MDPCCRGEGGLLDSSTRLLACHEATPTPASPLTGPCPAAMTAPLEREEPLLPVPLNRRFRSLCVRVQASTTGFVWMRASLLAPCGCLWRRLCGSP